MPNSQPRDAGNELAGRLEHFELHAPLVLALTRESAEMARGIAKRLGGTADRLFVEGMDTPSAYGRCSGAVSETGHVSLACREDESSGTEEALARDMLDHILSMVAQRIASMPGSDIADSQGRNVILVADGLAGGATMVAAIRGVRARNPLRLVAAVGIAPSRTLARIQEEADETVALSKVAKFGDVGRVRRAWKRATPVLG